MRRGGESRAPTDARAQESTARRANRALNVVGGAVLSSPRPCGECRPSLQRRSTGVRGSRRTDERGCASGFHRDHQCGTRPDPPPQRFRMLDGGCAQASSPTAWSRGQRGTSGRLRAVFEAQPIGIVPDTLPTGAQLRYAAIADSSGLQARPSGSGVWRVLLELSETRYGPSPDFSVVTMLPFTREARWAYRIVFPRYVAGGVWAAVDPARRPPIRYANTITGFIEVTQAGERYATSRSTFSSKIS